MKLDQEVTTMPTVGFNVEKITYGNVNFNIWEVGGERKIRSLWRHYFTDAQGVIFVVDSTDRGRIDQAQAELFSILREKTMKHVLVLVYANKQDMPGHMAPSEVSERMKMSTLKGKTWCVVGSAAKSGGGLTEGLIWLANNVPRDWRSGPLIVPPTPTEPIATGPRLMEPSERLLLDTQP